MSRGSTRPPSPSASAKSTCTKGGRPSAPGTASSGGTARSAAARYSGAVTAATISSAAAASSAVSSAVRKIGVSLILKGTGKPSSSSSWRTTARYFSSLKAVLKARRSAGSMG